MKIRVVVVEPMKAPEVREVENEAWALGQIVDGYLEVVPLTAQLHVVCNEEFMLRDDLAANRKLPDGTIICGTFLVARARGEDYVSVTDQDVALVNQVFGQQVVLDLESFFRRRPE